MIGSTHICKLNNEVSALGIWEHREDILAGFAVALTNQEVSLLLQQLLSLSTWNCPMVPLLIPQRLITDGDHINKLRRDGDRKIKLEHIKNNVYEIF